MTVVAMRSHAFAGRGALPAPGLRSARSSPGLFNEGQASGEIRPDTPPLELAQIFSGIFMYTIVSWLAARPADARTGAHDQADLEGRLMRAFDVFLDGCYSAKPTPTSGKTRRGAPSCRHGT